MDAPGEESYLVPLARALLLVLEVVHRPSAIRLRKVGDEVVVVWGLGLLLDDDVCLVGIDGENNVLDLLAQLERLEGFET